MNVHRDRGRVWAGLCLVLVMLALAALAVTICSKKNDATTSASSSAVVAPPPAPHLSPPCSEVRLGMSVDELKKLFPPREDIGKCAPRLVGGDPPAPMEMPGSEKQPHARCARTATSRDQH